jgi:hypothetical protein
MRTEPLESGVENEMTGASCTFAAGAEDAVDRDHSVADGTPGDVDLRRIFGALTTSPGRNSSQDSAEHSEHTLAEFRRELAPVLTKRCYQLLELSVSAFCHGGPNSAAGRFRCGARSVPI